MRITPYGIRPCSHCLRARQVVKDGLGRVFQRPATHIEYTTDAGTLLVDAATHKIVGTSARLGVLLGIEIYAAKGILTHVETGRKVGTYSRSRKLHLPGKVLETNETG